MVISVAKRAMHNSLSKIVPKLWGVEIWYVDDVNYCGKKIIIIDGCSTSMHYHNHRDKTVLVTVGCLEVKYLDQPDSILLRIGESLRIKPGVAHQFIAPSGQGPLELIEFSTQHSPDDTTRVGKKND